MHKFPIKSVTLALLLIVAFNSLSACGPAPDECLPQANGSCQVNPNRATVTEAEDDEEREYYGSGNGFIMMPSTHTTTIIHGNGTTTLRNSQTGRSMTVPSNTVNQSGGSYRVAPSTGTRVGGGSFGSSRTGSGGFGRSGGSFGGRAAG